MTNDHTGKSNHPGVFISTDEIDARVRSLAAEISADYADRDLFLVGLLKGSFVFLADLIRKLTVPASVDFMAATSYVGTKSSGTLIILKNLNESVRGKNVLIVEDIIDTGLTLSDIRQRLLDEQPESLRICTLLDKPARREQHVPVDYVGFEIEDRFVVGYGIDYDERFRWLPYVGVVDS